jgi:hypothetical protein
VKLLIFALALLLQTPTKAPTIIPPKEVHDIVEPILDLCVQAEMSRGEQQNDANWRAAKLIGDLLQSKAKNSDEALVVLMNFYIGESTGGDLRHQISVRGKRMLPLLVKYRAARVSFPNRSYPSSILLEPDIRNRDFDEVIKYVRKGKILGED